MDESTDGVDSFLADPLLASVVEAAQRAVVLNSGCSCTGADVSLGVFVEGKHSQVCLAANATSERALEFLDWMQALRSAPKGAVTAAEVHFMRDLGDQMIAAMQAHAEALELRLAREGKRAD